MKIDEKEKEERGKIYDKIYINALETENVNLKQVKKELEEKIKTYE